MRAAAGHDVVEAIAAASAVGILPTSTTHTHL